MKKLPRALATATFLAPMGVAALGVGNIELNSALNQPLNAKIALVTSSSESSSDIKVSLASPAAFKRAGVERYFYLSNIRFKPVVAVDGSISVKVTSHDIIREPFLNFLVEVNWPQGRALKEFTVLLDPPVTLREAETVIQVAPVTRRQENAVVSSNSNSERAVSYSATPLRTTASAGSSVVGPTQKNDTLWSVALGANKDSSISQEQMMMSIYKKNRHAFYQNNVNALKQGQRLSIPTREEVLELSKREARRQFSDQYKVWAEKSNRKSSVKQTSTQSESPNDVLGSEQQLTLITPEEDVISDSSGLSKQDSGAGGNAGASVDASAEVAETARQENAELQRRMLSLEEQVSKMQRLLVLKDEQLAALQGGSASEAVSEEGAAEDEPQNEGRATVVDTADAVATEEEVVAVAEESGLSDVSPEEVVTEADKVDAAAPLLEETPLYEDPIYLAAGGVVLLLLGLAVVAGRRKRALEEDVATAESILVGSDEPVESHDELIAPVVDSRESEAGIPAESSFLSEFTPSDFDTLESDNDEVDPITEADVYLAYGRYQQAEDLVRQAIETAPENEEYKLKLLEIHFATEDKNSFLSLAKEIHASCAESSPELWMRAVEMGQDLCPEESLFLDHEEALIDDEPVSEELVLADEDEELIIAEQVEEGSEAVKLNFGEEIGREEQIDESSDEQDSEVVDSLEFDFGEVAAEVDVKEVTELDGEEESNLINFGSVDISDSIGEVAEEAVASIDDEVTEAPAEENDEFSFDFEMTPSATAEGEPELVVSEEAFDLNIDDDVVSSLTDMDEVETKLDLAKAYVDMEDETSATGILEEVLEQGNDAQKAEAQSLIDGLKG